MRLGALSVCMERYSAATHLKKANKMLSVEIMLRAVKFQHTIAVPKRLQADVFIVYYIYCGN